MFETDLLLEHAEKYFTDLFLKSYFWLKVNFYTSFLSGQTSLYAS